MSADAISDLSATEQARLIRAREVKPAEIVEHYLSRIDAVNPRLNAYVTVAADQALEAAAAAEAAVLHTDAAELSPLHGVALSVKDDTETADVRTTYSSKIYADHVPEADAPIVARMKDAGMVLLGKTNVPEFDTSFTDSELNGPCRNPWDLNRSPAGSSGGAASAMGARLCSVAHGTDGAGSVRVPASFCGVVGMKPTRGRVAFGPEYPVDRTGGQSSSGPLARTVEDLAHLLDVMTGLHTGGPYWTPAPERLFADELGKEVSGLRIAYTTQPPLAGELDLECIDAVEKVAGLLTESGHRLEEATPAWEHMMSAAMMALGPSLGVYVLPEDVDRLEPRNRRIWEMSQQLSAADFVRGVADSQPLQQKFLEFWEGYDLLLSPTCGILPPGLDFAPWDQSPEEHMEALALNLPNFASPFNVTGQPAISVPVVWTDDGLPVGTQLVGRRGDDALLIRIAHSLEQAQPWRHRAPDKTLLEGDNGA